MKRIVLLIVLGMVSFLQAEEAAVSSEVTAQEKSGVYVRGGFLLSNGSSIKRDETLDTLNDTYTQSSEAVAMIGSAVDFSLGYEVYSQHVRIYGNIKIAYEDIETYELKTTQTAVGIEGFTAMKQVNLNYGCMLVGGSSVFSKVQDNVPTSEPVKFFGAEPYVGLDGLFEGNFGYYVKLGYEIRGYDSLIREEGPNEVTNDFVIYNFNAGGGLLYKF